MFKIRNFTLSAIILATLISCVQPESEFTYFGNMGPDHWSEHYNQCSGKHQSPININDVDVVNRTYTEMLYKNFDKIPLEATIFNNGHTVLVKLSYEGDIPTISEGPLEGKGTYQFQQLHFHWGEDNTVGSEDRINDVAYPMELHVVFRNSKYDSFEEAVRRDDGVLVMAAFYEIGNYTNFEYDNLTTHLELIHEPHTNATLKETMDLWSLLPKDLNRYYTYIGSLTTPPCSEDVIWIDFINPIGISEDLIERFRYLKTFDGSSLTHNFRPVQPLNNRKVYRSVPEIIERIPDDFASEASSIKLKSSILYSLPILSILLVYFNLKTHFHIF
ncbi:carbonic anhydrase 2 [Lucilia sericata]|uniref:carbonic anhydrase 2 n=1 Tax=Lucilia sericata TaxID=13632 RepID=UPI0018A829CC|nr:carbonic anhydrase 2 [Lucilia sericata]XP_037815616.1 carbonic anhydrase 2 [Lucilia sericata]